jgi:hypothetical protein
VSLARRYCTLCLLAMLLVSCGGGSNPVAPAPGVRRSELSGIWTGTVTQTQAGACTTSATPLSVTLTWTVTDAGELSIRDPDLGPMAGTIDDLLRITTTRRTFATCFGTDRSYDARYTGAVTNDRGRYEARLESLEEVCPPNCIFRITYALTKS